MSTTKIVRNNYTVELDEPELYVDNLKRGRSGHMTHAMAEFAPGCFIDFNSNCSAKRASGHSTFGWVEYRISKDCGKTYSDVHELPISKDYFYDGVYMISVEKAVACNDGSIVAFCLRNTILTSVGCEPWSTPEVIISTDEGETWSEPTMLCPHQGRIYDALYHNGEIYVLIFCNPYFLGKNPEDVYRIYKSSDNGKTFEELCVIPFETLRRGYGSILFDEKGILHAYAYNESSERELDHAISEDCGKTWKVCEPCYVAHGIRNPQTALIDGVYVLHGRAEKLEGFVLYTSEDGYTWDEGTFLIENKGAACYYSNNLNLKDENGNFLLIQYSDTSNYPQELNHRGETMKVNVMHQRLRIIK